MAALEPGKTIAPAIDHEGVKLLAERLYGIVVLELTELNGYDDKNYMIIEDPNVKNPLITEHSPHGYVLKILNSMDSQTPSIVEAQNEIMNYLNARNIVCPKPIRNVFGHLYSTETIGGRPHAVRLLRYVPGARLKDVAVTEPLLYQLGEFVANLDNKLQNFNHSGLLSRQHAWMLTSVPELDKFKFAVKDPQNLELAEEVIEEFKYAILPKLEELEKGVIHGDVNEMNVLVGPKAGSKSEYTIEGIIDFGDIQYSYYVFELAITMTYGILVAQDVRAAGLVLAGYTVTRRLPDHEYRLLKTLISSRLVQSLVMGAYTKEQDPKNAEYLTSTEKAHGWDILRTIRKSKVDENGDPTDWKSIANEYLTKS